MHVIYIYISVRISTKIFFTCELPWRFELKINDVVFWEILSLNCGLFSLNFCKDKNHLFPLQYSSSKVFDVAKFYSLVAFVCMHVWKMLKLLWEIGYYKYCDMEIKVSWYLWKGTLCFCPHNLLHVITFWELMPFIFFVLTFLAEFFLSLLKF